MLRFQLRIRPAKVFRMRNAEKRIGIRYATISTYFDKRRFSLEHKCGKAYQSTHISSPTLIISISLFECDKQIRKMMNNSVAFLSINLSSSIVID